MGEFIHSFCFNKSSGCREKVATCRFNIYFERMDVNKIKLLYDLNTSINNPYFNLQKKTTVFTFHSRYWKKAHFGGLNVVLMRKVKTRVYSYWSFNDNAGALQKQNNGTVWYLVNSLFSVLNIHVKLNMGHSL